MPPQPLQAYMDLAMIPCGNSKVGVWGGGPPGAQGYPSIGCPLGSWQSPKALCSLSSSWGTDDSSSNTQHQHPYWWLGNVHGRDARESHRQVVRRRVPQASGFLSLTPLWPVTSSDLASDLFRMRPCPDPTTERLPSPLPPISRCPGEHLPGLDTKAFLPSPPRLPLLLVWAVLFQEALHTEKDRPLSAVDSTEGQLGVRSILFSTPRRSRQQSLDKGRYRRHVQTAGLGGECEVSPRTPVHCPGLRLLFCRKRRSLCSALSRAPSWATGALAV